MDASLGTELLLHALHNKTLIALAMAEAEPVFHGGGGAHELRMPGFGGGLLPDCVAAEDGCKTMKYKSQ